MSSPICLTLVESLARAIAQRERLSRRELPRCRREVRLQLAISHLAPLRSDSEFPARHDQASAPVDRQRFR